MAAAAAAEQQEVKTEVKTEAHMWTRHVDSQWHVVSTGYHQIGHESEVTKLPAASMQELPPFGIGWDTANKYQSKGRQLPKLMCPTNHAPKNLSLDRAYGFDMWSAISAERPNSAERVALTVGLVSHGDVTSASTQRNEDSLPRLLRDPRLRDPRLRTHVVVELCVGKHGVSFGESGP